MPPPTALYVHWPFCKRLCTYCAFVKYTDEPALAAPLVDGMLEQLRRLVRVRGRGPPRVDALFLGGGSPSVMPVADLARLLDGVRREADPASTLASVTLEVNPSDASEAYLDAVRDAGITRISLGIQSLDDDTLARIGRTHSARDGLLALERALVRFDRVSADVLVGRPRQTVAECRREIATLAATGIGHLSAYQLTIERGTPLGKAVDAGLVLMPDVDEQAAFHETVVDEAIRLGFEQYEVSNFARSAADQGLAQVMGWHGGEYVGLGPGAHSRMDMHTGRRHALVGRPTPHDFLADLQRDPDDLAVGVNRALSRDEHVSELVMTAMRTRTGLSPAILPPGVHLAHLVDADALAAATAQGWIESTADGGLAFTRDGLMRSDGLTLDVFSPAFARGDQ